MDLKTEIEIARHHLNLTQKKNGNPISAQRFVPLTLTVGTLIFHNCHDTNIVSPQLYSVALNLNEILKAFFSYHCDTPIVLS